jgi:hypothetical protein
MSMWHGLSIGRHAATRVLAVVASRAPMWAGVLDAAQVLGEAKPRCLKDVGPHRQS